MNAEFFDALAAIEKEKGIPKAYMLERIQQALITAFKRDNAGFSENIFVETDEVKKEIRMYIRKEVVEQPENTATQITLDEAKAISPRVDIGDFVNIEVKTHDFGRIAAQTAKQVIIQGIREAERGMIYDEYNSKEHEILTALVTRIDPRNGNVIVELGAKTEKTEAVLIEKEQIRGERLREGDRVKVYVAEVRRNTKGPQIIISRTHPGLVKRLFELEVPEIHEGLVEIRSVAREAGMRTKLAVFSTDDDVDPIGACVGPRGGRVSSVVDELRGEKIDIIKYSDDIAEFVAAALAPSDVLDVTMLEDGKSCRVIVPDGQLSLAIGKEGQNARLAAKLTGIKIDIKSESSAQQL